MRTLPLLAVLATSLYAETGQDAWLRYAPIEGAAAARYAALPATVVALGDSSVVIRSAREELIQGIRGMLGRTLRMQTVMPQEPAIVLGTVADLALKSDLKIDGFLITTKGKNILIAGADDRGVLYGTFAFLRRLALHQSIAALNERQEPHSPARWINHWDNLDGTIERGYGGRSIFFD